MVSYFQYVLGTLKAITNWIRFSCSLWKWKLPPFSWKYTWVYDNSLLWRHFNFLRKNLLRKNAFILLDYFAVKWTEACKGFAQLLLLTLWPLFPFNFINKIWKLNKSTKLLIKFIELIAIVGKNNFASRKQKCWDYHSKFFGVFFLFCWSIFF